MKENQENSVGQILNYVTLPVNAIGNRSETQTVPVVQGDPNVFLDNDDGLRARSLAPRGSCIVWGGTSQSCAITYCWSGTDGSVYTAHLTVGGSNGQSNPTSMTSSNTNYMGPYEYNTGFGGWFRSSRHECSNSDTILGTTHRISRQGNTLQLYNAHNAFVDHFRCDNCGFGGVSCDGNLLNNLLVFTNGQATGVTCTANDNGEL